PYYHGPMNTPRRLLVSLAALALSLTTACGGTHPADLPAGAGVSEGILKLGAAICPAGTCPADAVITATPLKSPVTAQTKGSELAADADTGTAPYSLPLTSAQADIAGSEYQWLMLTSNKDELITFADVAASEQPSLALTYLPAGPPSKVLNLATQPGDGGAIASWGLPESTGSVAMLNGYDVEVTSSSGGLVKTLEATDPYAAITGLTNGENHTIKVRAKTEFGISDWVSATVTPKAVPPPPVQNPTQQCIPFLDTPPSLASVKAAGVSGAQEYITRVQAYFGAQDAVLEGRAATIWDAPGVTPQSPSTAKLSLLNTPLANTFGAMRQEGATRTGSSVNLSDVVVQGMPDGKVHVSAQVRRTWRLQSTSASTAKTAGTVDPSESTISIFVFDRCGNIQEIQAPNPAYEDPTDNDDPKPYPPSAGGSAPPPPVWGSTTEWYKARVDLREGTSQRDFLGNERDSKTKKLRFGKGWFVQARSESYWDKHEPQWSNRWMIRNFVNRVQHARSSPR
ncbi:fibronectin type III domain-containing protein, partial [Nonomuraea sp. NPDC055795]